MPTISYTNAPSNTTNIVIRTGSSYGIMSTTSVNSTIDSSSSMTYVQTQVQSTANIKDSKANFISPVCK